MPRPSIKPLLIALTMALGVGTALTLPVKADQEEKAVRVRDAQPDAAMKLQVITDKPAYRVDEPIRLKVRGDQDYYLYVYSVDEASGNAWLLLPNRQQPYNRMGANQWRKVPGTNLEFVADRPGTEKLIVVASTKKVDIDPMKLTGKGDFAEAKAVDLEDNFESKGIKIRDAAAPQAVGTVVKRLEVKILGKGERGSDEEVRSQAAAFVSTTKARYQEGDQMHIVYGADAPGWVHLYVIEPDGTRSLLKRQKIKGDEQLKVSARAVSPFGKHKLVAVHSQTEAFDEDVLDRAGEAKDDMAKGIRLEGGDAGIAIAVKHIGIYKN